MDTSSQGYGIIKDHIQSLSKELRAVSLDLWDHPELAWEEHRSHDKLVEYLKSKGFKVTPKAYGIETAFEAIYEHGKGGRTIGFNSEYDALPNIGHACGHNLIAIGGIGAALACAEALKKTNTAGKVILLGTPAEEKDGGKIPLLKAGAYEPMDACLMIHPAPLNCEGLGHMLAIAEISLTFTGHPAHAAGAPWEGVNALDAAVQFYNSVSMMRQQIKPYERCHTIIKMRENTVVNIIPDYAHVMCAVRSMTIDELEDLKSRLDKMAEAACLATGCKVEKKWLFTYEHVRQNQTLGQDYTHFLLDNYKIDLNPTPPIIGSTDFGNITNALPGLHPMYGIDTGGPKNGNHTEGFTTAARTEDSHVRTLKATTGIAAVGWRILTDESFAKEARKTFKAGL